MDRTITDPAIKVFLNEISKRLDAAASIAKAARVCAAEGNVAKAVEIVLDIEQLSYESNNLLNAASTLNRIANE